MNTLPNLVAQVKLSVTLSSKVEQTALGLQVGTAGPLAAIDRWAAARLDDLAAPPGAAAAPSPLAYFRTSPPPPWAAAAGRQSPGRWLGGAAALAWECASRWVADQAGPAAQPGRRGGRRTATPCEWTAHAEKHFGGGGGGGEAGLTLAASASGGEGGAERELAVGAGYRWRGGPALRALLARRRGVAWAGLGGTAFPAGAAVEVLRPRCHHGIGRALFVVPGPCRDQSPYSSACLLLYCEDFSRR